MINPKEFFETLHNFGIDFFVGVPDSLLKHFCAYINENCEKSNHIICANEGNAIAMAAGSYLATERIPLVYMQNSGLGNATNPLLSLADKEVYGIPMILLIGWRGEPGVKDEPQHIKQGRIQLALLDVMEIPYFILDENSINIDIIIEQAVNLTIELNNPVALVVKKNTFEEYKPCLVNYQDNFVMTREKALEIILNEVNNFHIISTTGKTSRELNELRIKRGEEPSDFLTVGSMGHSSSIAAGVALRYPSQKILCLDGDGAMLMHLGALAVIGKLKLKNFYHILLNNYCHESVGGQPTAADILDFESLAKAVGYQNYFCADNSETLTNVLKDFANSIGPVMLEIKVKKGARADLGRPKTSPYQNKETFIKSLGKQE